MHNVIWANQKTEYFVFRWLRAHIVFDVRCFFLHLSKHETSMQAFCRYVNYLIPLFYHYFMTFIILLFNNWVSVLRLNMNVRSIPHSYQFSCQARTPVSHASPPEVGLGPWPRARCSAGPSVGTATNTGSSSPWGAARDHRGSGRSARSNVRTATTWTAGEPKGKWKIMIRYKISI